MNVTVTRNGQNFGPYTIEQANALLLSGQLRSADMAWYEGAANWMPLNSIAGIINVPPPPPPLGMPPQSDTDKRILPAFLLAFFIGPLGIHRFYVGKTGSGVAMLVISLTLFGLIVTGIWALVDWIMILCGSFTDGNGKKITLWT